MATPSSWSASDPLVLLRQAIAAGKLPTPADSPSSEPIPDAAAATTEVPLARATHLRFSHVNPPVALPIDTPTRFATASDARPFDLRSIFYAWTTHDLTLPNYNAEAAKLNAELPPGADPVRSLAFVERLDLFTWLEGATQISEYLKPMADDADAVAAGAITGAGTAAAAKGGAVPTATLGRSGKGSLNPRLAAVYNGERRMGDRNSVLRGIKPTDFSHVRKHTISLMNKKPQLHGTPPTTALSLNQKMATRRPDPIILLSPSASSLLRMSNARSFLEEGHFQPPDSSAAASTLLHVRRLLRDIDPSRAIRFVLVEGTEQFKPEYWNRVVAVFTTGQTWQFKNYKWSSPADLFRRVPGVFLGWRGDQPPENIRNWGHRVVSVEVDRWRESAQPSDVPRHKDQEAVEMIWKVIQKRMAANGWKKDSGPTSL